MPTPLSRNKQPTIAQLQAAMDEFVGSRGWYGPESEKPQEPRNLAASISLEANEVLEWFQWSNRVEPDQVGAELADVVLYCVQLANVLGLDLGEALLRKLELNDSRFPAVEGQPWQRRLAS
jgi:NTP pyrophosphatase (non-canonical NTP hydrolase)